MPKINVLTFFTKKVSMNFQAVPGIRFCDKNNLLTRTHHQNNTKFEVITFEPEKMEMESGARFLAFSILYEIILFSSILRKIVNHRKKRMRCKHHKLQF